MKTFDELFETKNWRATLKGVPHDPKLKGKPASNKDWHAEGGAAHKAKKIRIIPKELHGSTNFKAADAWYRGWDKSNLASEEIAMDNLTETHAIYDSKIKRVVSRHVDADRASVACKATNFANWHKNAVLDRYKIVELPKPPKISYLGKSPKSPTKPKKKPTKK